jgi:uncharacterized Zn finger protein
MATVKELLTIKWLKQNSDLRFYERGERIAKDNFAVQIFRQTTTKLYTEVMGTRSYVVKFSVSGNLLEASCTCPAFQDYDGLCKHIVGAGLHAVNNKFAKPEKTIAEEIQKYVDGLEESELRALAFQALLNDQGFRNDVIGDDEELFAKEDRREQWRE